MEHDVESLTARYTARHGFRTYDIVHVASARIGLLAISDFRCKGSQTRPIGRNEDGLTEWSQFRIAMSATAFRSTCPMAVLSM